MKNHSRPKSPNPRNAGIAAILFLLLMPFMLGMFALFLEGARYLKARSQLGDAAEVAALALSARESMDVEENKKLASAFLETIMDDSLNINTRVKALTCDKNPACNKKINSEFLEYHLRVNSHHDSWFTARLGIGYDKTITLGNNAIARKYQGGLAIDVIFVADFSGSMNDSWKGEIKIDMLRNVLGKVARLIENGTASQENDQDKSTMALVPFHEATQDLSADKTKTCVVRQVRAPEYGEAISNLLVEKNCLDFEGIDEGIDIPATNIFTISPTTDSDQLRSSINKLTASGFTASYEGIIRAAQIAKKGHHARRLIIILSDGEDYANYANYHTDLNDRHYCDHIRKKLAGEKSATGASVNAEIAVIGFDYDVVNNKNLYRCADKGKVFSAVSPDEVYEKLLAMLEEEIGHLYKRR